MKYVAHVDNRLRHCVVQCIVIDLYMLLITCFDPGGHTLCITNMYVPFFE